MQIDDLFALKSLQEAALSPDGTKVLYTVTHVDEEAEKEFSTIYLLDLSSGETRQMTTGKQVDAGPRFSPDGTTIAFISDRKEKNQIFLLPVDGGEARQLTDLKQGASNPEWSPDGSKIAFTAGVDYGEDDPPDYSKDPYRVTRNVWRFDAIGALDLAVSNVYMVDVASGDVEQLTGDDVVSGGLKWSPDGTRILFLASMLPDRFKAFQPIVRTVDLDKNVNDIEPDWGMMSAVHWLADGSGFVFIGNPDDDSPIGTHPDLWVYRDGSFENRTPGLELALGGGLEGRLPNAALRETHIPFEGDSCFVSVQVGGTVQIYRISLVGGVSAEPVVTGDRALYLLDKHADKLLLAASDVNKTPDVYICDLDGGSERQLTDINDALMRERPVLQVEALHFKGVDGVDVEGWYVKPVVGEAPYPTVLWIHGGPHGAQGHTFAFDTHMLAGAGYGVMYVNHRASTGYGDAISTAIKGDWGNLDYNDLMAGVDEAVERGLADPEKLGCCGISGGGNLSCWIVGNTDRFKAAVPQNPVTNWVSFYGVSDIGVWFGVEQMGGHPHEIPEIYARCSPITYAHQCTTPTLLIQCEHDWRCPPEQSEQFYTVLKANGCTVEMVRHPAGAHGGSIRGPLPLRKSNLRVKLDWFDRYILGREGASESI